MGKMNGRMMLAGGFMTFLGWLLTAAIIRTDGYFSHMGDATLYQLYLTIVFAGVSIVGIALFMVGLFSDRSGRIA